MIEALEGPARAIAANKRGLPASHPVIDRVWTAYIGQARACILAFIEESAVYRKAQAIEARRAATLGAVHESAVATPCAQACLPPPPESK